MTTVNKRRRKRTGMTKAERKRAGEKAWRTRKSRYGKSGRKKRRSRR